MSKECKHTSNGLGFFGACPLCNAKKFKPKIEVDPKLKPNESYTIEMTQTPKPPHSKSEMRRHAVMKEAEPPASPRVWYRAIVIEHEIEGKPCRDDLYPVDLVEMSALTRANEDLALLKHQHAAEIQWSKRSAEERDLVQAQLTEALADRDKQLELRQVAAESNLEIALQRDAIHKELTEALAEVERLKNENKSR